MLMLHHLHNLFIPHPGNDHRPHALRPRALRWYVGLLVGVKVLAALLLFTAYPDFAKLSSDIKEEVMRMINASRAEADLPALIANPALARAAEFKASDMLARQYFEHITPEGKLPWEWINKNEYRFKVMGENLAMDFTTGESAHLALMRSDTHRDNILDARYRNVGVGVVTGVFQGRETNILVEFFAEPVPQRSAAAAIPAANAAEGNVSPAAAESSPSESLPPAPQDIEVLPAQFETGARGSADIRPSVAENESKTSFVTTGVDTPAEGTSTATPVASLKLQSAGFVKGLVQQQSSELAFLYRVSVWTQRVFYAALVYLVLTLLINVFVKAQVRQTRLIAQTLTVILLIGGLSLVDVHIIEQLTNAVSVLSF